MNKSDNIVRQGEVLQDEQDEMERLKHVVFGSAVM